ncbi:MAG: hypothetical protein KAW40_05850, partial [Candidatus Aenigmarchaeota archaeon]|nr:hypothetical protein [Candidatus Aenigmarchaeota archaeon]
MRGEILKLNFLIGIVLMLAFFVLNISFYSVPTFAVNSTNDNFSVTPDNVSINWIEDMINVTSFVDNLIVVVNNTATEIDPKYWTSNPYSSCGPGSCWPNDTVMGNCFSGATGSGMKFKVENATGTYSILTYSGELNDTNSTTFNLTAYQYCPPGLYSGYFYVFKNGTSSEKAKVTANVSIPINPQNTFNFTGRYATFKGSFTAENEEDYHSFYFNTSHIENSTGGTIKLTGMTKDIDIFLFSGSSVLKRSINKNSEDEEIEFVPWPSQEIMEIRVYGNNISDYNGYIYFTPLGVANASDTNQEFNDTNPVNFGVLDPNQTSSEVLINITNIDDQSANDVGETSEIYRVDRWLNQNQAGTYWFLVPGFAEKVKIKVEWTANTTYNLFLRSVNNALMGNLSEKYKNANKTGSVQEEFVIVNSSISESNDGYWNITVLNTSAINGSYNVTAYVWMPESGWFESDYTNGFDFNSSGGVNSSLNFSVNITVPELNLTNGTYEGFLRYNNTEGWKLNVPFEFQVKAGMLFMNNDNITSSTYTVRDNMGFDRLGSNAIVLNITYNNTGGYPIYYNETNSSNKLYLTSNTSNYIEFIVDQLPGDGSKINSNTNGTMDIRLLINTSKTNDFQGTYTGNITFNTTNATVNSSSYPFRTYVFTMSVILNDDLTVNISSLTPST